MKSILKYLLLASIRDRLYLGIFIFLAASFSVSIFLGSTALVENQQMTAAYIAGSSRSILALGMILFVCLSVSRSFENKEVEFIISKPISRETFVLGYLIGFLLIALLILIPLAIAMFIVTDSSKIGLAVWVGSMVLEMILVIAFSLLASLILRNSLSAIMASFGFYILSRLMGMFLLAIEVPQTFAYAKYHFFPTLLKFLSIIFPRLDLFGQSAWLNHGISDFMNLKIILLQSAVYAPLLIFMSFHDFKKKQF